MSRRLALLQAALRRIEKPALARAGEDDAARLRRQFERQAWLWFHAPRGSRARWERLGALEALRVTGPGAATGAASVGLILYFHGGGYVFGSPRTHRAMLARLSRRTGVPALLPRYALAPEHPFPAAFEDAVAAWEAAVRQVPPERIVLGGDSAGGGLALALLGWLCREGRPGPAGAFAFAPLTDLGFSGDSIRENAASDSILPVSAIPSIRRMVLAGADPADPRASPLRAGFGGAGPVYLTASDCEILRDDTRRMAARLRAEGVAVTERIEPGRPHVWQIFGGLLPEAEESLRDVADWIGEVIPGQT